MMRCNRLAVLKGGRDTVDNLHNAARRARGCPCVQKQSRAVWDLETWILKLWAGAHLCLACNSEYDREGAHESACACARTCIGEGCEERKRTEREHTRADRESKSAQRHHERGVRGAWDSCHRPSSNLQLHVCWVYRHLPIGARAKSSVSKGAARIRGGVTSCFSRYSFCLKDTVLFKDVTFGATAVWRWCHVLGFRLEIVCYVVVTTAISTPEQTITYLRAHHVRYHFSAPQRP